jgi:hypothetical protein
MPTVGIQRLYLTTIKHSSTIKPNHKIF